MGRTGGYHADVGHLRNNRPHEEKKKDEDRQELDE
jgi:hypothetical protein